MSFSGRKNYSISVIISFYNAEKYVAGCIECLLNQTFNDVQIIMVDDGSTDQGAEIVRNYECQYDNITLVEKSNSGQGDSRNVGIELAAGKYVYYLDVDDFITKDALENLYRAAEAYGADLVVFNSVNVKDDVQVCDKLEQIPVEKRLGGLYTHRSMKPDTVIDGRKYVVDSLNSKEGFFPPIWIGFYRRQFLVDKKIRFEKILHEDNIYSIEVALEAKKVVYIDKTFHIRRMVSTSTTHQKKTERHIQGALRVMEHAISVYDSQVKDNESKSAFHKWCLLSGGIAYDTLMKSDRTFRKKYKKQYLSMMCSNPKQFNYRLIIKSIVKI